MTASDFGKTSQHWKTILVSHFRMIKRAFWAFIGTAITPTKSPLLALWSSRSSNLGGPTNMCDLSQSRKKCWVGYARRRVQYGPAFNHSLDSIPRTSWAFSVYLRKLNAFCRIVKQAEESLPVEVSVGERYDLYSSEGLLRRWTPWPRWLRWVAVISCRKPSWWFKTV